MTRPADNVRWREVVDAAAECFHRKGYAGTSIHDVASAVGLLKGSLYHYIRSKDDLLFAVVREHHEAVFANVERVKSLDASYVEKLRAFIRWHVEYNAANWQRAGVFYHEFRYLSAERLAAIVDARDAYERELRTLIAEGAQAGEIRADVDPKLIAFVVLGVLNSLHQWYRPDGPLPAAAIGEQFATLLIQGVVERSTGSRLAAL